MKAKWKSLIILISIIILMGLILWGPIVSSVEQPKYQVISSEDNFEVRRYEPMIIAEVIIEGKREDSISTGFRLLADYIFGNNISMTAPVTQQQSQKIAMTAPVSQRTDGSGWAVNFVMPSQYSMESLPKPNNEDVILKEISAKTFAVIRFSGLNKNKNIAKHEKKLQVYISENKLVSLSAPVYAFYNPPWTVPFLRRNEVMIEVNKGKDL